MPDSRLRIGVLFLVLNWMSSGLRLTAAEPSVAETPEAAASDPDFLLQGEYTGTNAGFQIVALGAGEFQIVKLAGGLPGAGWNSKDRQVADGDAAAVRELMESQKLTRVERQSPTLGLKPPADAVVLFDGTQASLEKHWQPGAAMTPEGLLVQGATSRETFTDYSLHLEFRLPYMPEAREQGRGNSGVYYQGRYETQVLDSFGLEGKHNECGGLYSVRDPNLNMCLPPLLWQTYDADFTAARWDAAGNKIANAKLAVRLNGVVVHQDVEIPNITTAAPVAESASPGPVYLQDHGNPVRFRNIWVLPRNAERDARRPIVPGFERFYAGQGEAARDGGELLAGELGCVNCHADGGLASRQGPVLDGIGLRAKAGWLAKFVESPHAVKPGTTMPAMFEGLPESQRQHEVQAIVSYLAGASTPPERSGDRAAAQRGAKLFREIGCVACHEPRSPDGGEAVVVNRAATIPLPDLPEKYSINSLALFLKNPHAARPSGRMPSFGLEDRDAVDLACFLIGDPTTLGEPNVKFAVYHGDWDLVPDFDTLTPAETGLARGLDLSVAGRANNYALRFEGFWKVEKTGQYRFFLASDDGSRMWIDDDEVVASDGIHPHQENIGRAQLTAGVHRVRVGYFQGGGEWSLTAEFDGNGFVRQPLEALLRPTAEEAERPPEPVKSDDPQVFRVDLGLLEEGRALFQSRGCAACHQVTEDGARLASTRPAKPFRELAIRQGCLAVPSEDGAPSSAAPRPEAPQFDLNPAQRSALAAVVEAAGSSEPRDGKRLIDHTLASFHCYACHKRDGRGGPERDRDPLFLTSIPEMGDEGRVPPPLDGVGDKLRPEWLRHVLSEGAKDRKYIKTRMPKFGGLPVEELVAAFVAVDQRDSGTTAPALQEPEHRVIATGRKLAGNGGMACVKCHTFGRYPASGIQALDLQTMTRRIREDWFYRYLVDPQVYRPGTRMPTAFVDGVSAVKDVYEGRPEPQMAALWKWLEEGGEAGVPEGVLGETIELIPTDSPILYRNFLEGLSPRGIAVGYPEKAHLAWDAERMCLAQVWHGRFLDAGMHWNGRGSGNQKPLGDHVMRIEETTPVAVLESRESAWPSRSPRESGYAFRGYHLDPQQRPTFRYDLLKPKSGEDAAGVLVSVTDQSIPAVELGASMEPGFRRTLVLTADSAVEGLYFRAAAGSIEPVADSEEYVVEGQWRVRVATNPPGEAFVRTSNGRQELIVPLRLENGRVEIREEIAW